MVVCLIKWCNNNFHVLSQIEWSYAINFPELTYSVQCKIVLFFLRGRIEVVFAVDFGIQYIHSSIKVIMFLIIIASLQHFA